MVHGTALLEENRRLVKDELVKFEKYPVEVQQLKKIADHFTGICRIYLK